MTPRTRAISRAATTGRWASSTPTTRSGWMGRLLDATGEPGNPLQGLSLDYSLAPSLATTKVPVAAISSAANYNMWAWGMDEPITAPAYEDVRGTGRAGRPLARVRAGAERVT